MIPQFPQFKSLELSDKEEIENFTKKFHPYSDFNFVSMWCWNIGEGIFVSYLNKNLVVRFKDYITGKPFYSFLGDHKINDTAKILLDLSHKENIDCTLKLVPEICAKGLDASSFRIEEDQDNHDYIIPIINLKPHDGRDRKLSSRRKLALKLRQMPDFSVQVIDLHDPQISEEILNVFFKWESQREGDLNEIEHLKDSMQKIFKLNNIKNIICIGTFIKNRLVGYSINEILEDKYAIGHFQQADSECFAGIYAVLMQETGIYLDELGLQYLNLEQDLGIEGLKKWKTSYGSENFLKKYKVTLAG